jgi:hypothetical protein
MAQAKTKLKAAPKRRPASRKKPVSRKQSSSRKQTNSSKSAPAAAVSNATDKATSAVGNAADKAKMPLLAGGAALAGVAGGVVLGTRHAHRHNRMDKAIKLAHELQQVRQPTNGSKHRSPVEVVLEGLTARRSRS